MRHPRSGAPAPVRPQERALILALAVPRPDPERVRTLACSVDLRLLTVALSRQRLLALLGSRLIALDTERRLLPARFRDCVHAAMDSNRARAQIIELEALRLLGQLQCAGVRAMPLKGPFLAARLHGDVALRCSDDIDLLVAPEQLEHATEVLLGAGCRPPRQLDGIPRLHHILISPSGVPVELHWRVHWHGSAYGRQLLERARQDGLVLAPAPADELVSLLIFHARDGLLGLRLPADVLACALGSLRPSAADLARVIAADPQLEPFVCAAAASIEQTFCLSESIIQPRANLRGSRAFALSLADPLLEREPRLMSASAALVDLLLGGPGSLPTFLRYVLFRRQHGRGLERIRAQAVIALVQMHRMARVLMRARRRADSLSAG